MINIWHIDQGQVRVAFLLHRFFDITVIKYHNAAFPGFICTLNLAAGYTNRST